jgi:hypothetical protein
MDSEKTCSVCGRRIEWRAKWADSWGAITVCSKACRAQGIRAVDRELEAAIELLLLQRRRGATLCPSEAARHVRPSDWRPLMERCRRAARRLVAQGRLQILQGGRVVDPSDARGPIRLRWVESSADVAVAARARYGEDIG